MADEESTATVDETVDTSTNEEAQDTDVDLEDIEVSIEDITDETEEPEESEDVEEKEEEAETDQLDTEEDSKEDVVSDEDKQKQHNREMAEKRIQEKQAREQAQLEQQQEYVAEAEDERDTALRQLQVDAYNNKVERISNALTNGYEKAVKDFDILSSDLPAVKREVDAAIDAFQAQYVTVDAYGNPTEIRGDLYTYLQSKADSIAELTGLKVANQKASKDKEKSKVLTTPSKAPREKKADPDLDAFDEEARRY